MLKGRIDLMSDVTLEKSFAWSDPPQSERVRHGREPSEYWTQVAGTLRQNPGQWAQVATFATATSGSNAAGHASRIRSGRARAFGAGGYSAVHRRYTNEDGTVHWGVWAAYGVTPSTTSDEDTTE